MSQLGRPTQNNKTFRPDFIDSVEREYSLLSESELKLYEDTTRMLPMNFRLPRRTPVENRAPPPQIGQFLLLAHPQTKEITAKGKVAEIWLTARSNCGLIFITDFSRFTNSSVEDSNDQKKEAN